MSLYVYISRKPVPAEDAGPDITEQEWRTLASSQPDFRPPSADELNRSAHPGDPRAEDLMWEHPTGEPVLFVWFKGEIEVKGPDPQSIARMTGLAASLHARVVSETGEIFDARGNHAGFEPHSEFYIPPKKPSFLARLFGWGSST